MSKNSGLLPIRAVNSILEGKDNELPENMSSDKASSLKFCPLTSVNVERSFSVYESVLEEREGLTTENLAKIMICKCYYSKSVKNFENWSFLRSLLPKNLAKIMLYK